MLSLALELRTTKQFRSSMKMKTIPLRDSFVRVRLSNSKEYDLPCLRTFDGAVIKVMDYAGNELKHNTDVREVFFNGKRWSY